MSISELGALGEFFGSIAVLITLVYLAAQVRGAKAAVRASARQARAEQAVAIHQAVFTSDHMPEIISNVTSDTPAPLSPADRERYRFYLHSMHRHFESYFMLYRDGIVDQEVVDAQSKVFSRPIFNNELAREIWDWSKITLHPEYVAWVEEAYDAA